MNVKQKLAIAVAAILLITVSACTPFAQGTAPESYNLEISGSTEAGFNSITEGEIAQIVGFLASPDLEGRRSGTPENEIAGAFLAKSLEESSFAAFSNTFFQRFEISDLTDMDPYIVRVRLAQAGYTVELQGRNVIGILRGVAKSDEYIVLAAHYDHVGVQGGRLYPGADDNASGTAAVLEIAEAFGILAQEGIRPQRSIVVAFMDAEEWGLWGSEYFVAHSPMPVEDIVAVVNLDMVGRNTPGTLWVIGSPDVDDFALRSPQLARITERTANFMDFHLVLNGLRGREEQMFFRSDQAPFFLARPNDPIPVVFYTTGLHEDYHMPTDTADKIDTLQVRNIARFAFLVIWQIAELDAPPDYYTK